ncbi:MAG: deoxyribonuclease IV [Nitrospira sp.]|nr:deoxyribonuclease IV [Nitrospira sp.]
MRRLGVHTSIAGGLHLSLERAKALGCNTVQIFSHNPRGWALKQIHKEEASIFQSLRLKLNISPVFIHTSYLVNIASRDKTLRKKSIDLLIVEMDRADAIGADYVILHPGSASGDDEGVARKRAIDVLNEVALKGRWNAYLLIENTAGERGDISSTIMDLSDIIAGTKGSLISGICIDTCHAFAAGYDICNNEGIQKISQEIEKYIGFDKLKLVHLNDSKSDIGSGIDRHEHIGRGKIGMRGLQQLITYQLFKDIPLILETPKRRESDDRVNLRRVRKIMKHSCLKETQRMKKISNPPLPPFTKGGKGGFEVFSGEANDSS